MEGKIGNCGEYASDFQKLASYVGLECVTYTQLMNLHVATIVKINGQWIVVDPFMKESLFDNTLTMPVDFDIEYNRLKKEVRNSEWYQEQMQQAEWQRMAEAEEITWIEYYQRIYPGMSEAEIQQKFMNWDGYVDGLGN